MRFKIRFARTTVDICRDSICAAIIFLPIFFNLSWANAGYDSGMNVNSKDLNNGVINVSGCAGETIYIWVEFGNDKYKKSVYSLEAHNFGELNVDIKHVIPWYRDGNAKKSIHPGGGKSLVEELLLNDPSLIVADKKNRTNKIKFNYKGQNLLVTSEESESLNKDKNGRVRVLSDEYYIEDSKNLEPINIAKGDKKKILISVTVPEGVQSHVSKMKLVFKREAEVEELPLVVRVNDISLDEPEITYSVFYRALYNKSLPVISSERKTDKQLNSEFYHMAGAKYVNPTIYQSISEKTSFDRYMKIRGKYFPSQSSYFIVNSKMESLIKSGDVENLRIMLRQYEEYFRSQGKSIYFLLTDEPKKEEHEAFVATLSIFKEFQFDVFITGRFENLKNNIKEDAVYVLAYEPLKEYSEYVHKKDAYIFSYANPQVGVLNLGEIRFNYGLALLKNNYDGAMLYAYQDVRGSAWSDFDGRYRDHMFAYPTSYDVISTTSWIAFHEAIQDASYYATLKRYHSQLVSNRCPMYMHDGLIQDVENLISLSVFDEPASLDNFRRTIKSKLIAINGVWKQCGKTIKK